MLASFKASSSSKVVQSIYFSYPSTPALFAILETVTGLSPDIIRISTPCSLKYFKVSSAFYLSLSVISTNPKTSISSGNSLSLKEFLECASKITL